MNVITLLFSINFILRSNNKKRRMTIMDPKDSMLEIMEQRLNINVP
jgi:hypothetical protein